LLDIFHKDYEPRKKNSLILSTVKPSRTTYVTKVTNKCGKSYQKVIISKVINMINGTKKTEGALIIG
jgi:hypothetical protein